MENPMEEKTRQAVDLAGQGRVEGAIQLLKDVINEYPDYAPAYSILGSIYVEIGHSELAIEPLERAKELEPDDFKVRYWLGCALGRAFRLEEGISELKAADRLEPNDDEILRNIGWMTCMSGDVEEGRKILLHSLEIDPTNALTYNDMGASHIYTNDKDLEKAEEWLKKALSIDPQNPFIRHTWANLQDMIDSC